MLFFLYKVHNRLIEMMIVLRFFYTDIRLNNTITYSG